MADISSLMAVNAYPKNSYVNNVNVNTKGAGGAGAQVGVFTPPPQENFQAKAPSNNPFGVGRYADASLNGGGYGLAFGAESTGVHGNSEAVGKKLQLVG
ncbi:hypothetical protein IKA15_01385 [bacterium]|nr:hypothetical protein [bacterium]